MITLDEAKAHLRVDHSDEDADISLKLRFAAAIVQDYSGVDVFYSPTDVADAAVLMVLGELYVNREAGANPLSPSVRGVLERLRTPGFA